MIQIRFECRYCDATIIREERVTVHRLVLEHFARRHPGLPQAEIRSVIRTAIQRLGEDTP